MLELNKMKLGWHIACSTQSIQTYALQPTNLTTCSFQLVCLVWQNVNWSGRSASGRSDLQSKFLMILKFWGIIRKKSKTYLRSPLFYYFLLNNPNHGLFLLSHSPIRVFYESLIFGWRLSDGQFSNSCPLMLASFINFCVIVLPQLTSIYF